MRIFDWIHASHHCLETYLKPSHSLSAGSSRFPASHLYTAFFFRPQKPVQSGSQVNILNLEQIFVWKRICISGYNKRITRWVSEDLGLFTVAWRYRCIEGWSKDYWIYHRLLQGEYFYDTLEVAWFCIALIPVQINWSYLKKNWKRPTTICCSWPF